MTTMTASPLIQFGRDRVTRRNGVVVKDSNNLASTDGASSDLFTGVWTDKSKTKAIRVAIKQFRALDDATKRRLTRESDVWRKLNNENVLSFLGYCQDFGPSPLSPSFISPYCQFGNVLKYIIQHPMANKYNILVGIASGLSHLHKEGIIHGDLKGNNIVVDDQGVPLLCDFGRSHVLGQGYATGSPGALRCLAPELSSPDDETPQLSMATDVYSFAFVTLEILSGIRPFPKSNDLQVIVLVSRGVRPKQEHHSSIPSNSLWWGLLRRCWDQNPAKRPTMARVMQVMPNQGNFVPPS